MTEEKVSGPDCSRFNVLTFLFSAARINSLHEEESGSSKLNLNMPTFFWKYERCVRITLVNVSYYNTVAVTWY
jgi:hypothetical protein